jgi:thiol-activated cytolysin
MPSEGFTMRKTAVVAVALAGCLARPVQRSEPAPISLAPPAPPPPRPEAISNPEIDGYLASLAYDPRQVLAERLGDAVLPAQALPDERREEGGAIVVVRQVKHRLNGSVDDLILLDPTHGVVWPGALVRADQELVRGTPTPIQLRRAPMWLSVDLPGIGGNGVFAVDDPSHGTVQAAIDRALDYWNENQYREGYVSKSRSKYVATVVYSSEQLAAALGLSYGAVRGSLAAQFRATTTQERKVAMALFKQVFYTVSFDPPSRPGAVFHPAVTLDEVRAQVDKDVPAAFVSSVDYGRILLLRIESSADTQQQELEATVRYMAATGKVSAEHKKTLEKSQVTLITIGGNAEVNARAVDATRIEDLNAIIQGKNALYSKRNPGQPVAYTLRFLKDGRLARMGFSTDYTEVVYERHPHGWICFRHAGSALYAVKFFMGWRDGEGPKSWKSGSRGSGYKDVVPLRGDARDITINGQILKFTRWSDVFRMSLQGPPNRCYAVTGSGGWRIEESQ